MSATKAIWSGPGIIQGFLNLRAESKLTQETLEKWLDEEYIPAMLETKIIRAAQRYKAANPEYLKQNMVVYELADLASAKDGKLQEVPRSSNLFPSSDPVDAFVESEARILCFVEEYKKKEHDEGSLIPMRSKSTLHLAHHLMGNILRDTDAAKTIIYAAMEPGVRGEADLDAWYREEVSRSPISPCQPTNYDSTMSKCLSSPDG